MLLSIERKRVEPDILVLEIAGKITLGRESHCIEPEVDELIRQNDKKVIFDLSRVEYIDSTGIGIIAVCGGKLKEAGGDLRVAGAKGFVLNVLKIAKIETLLGPVYPTVFEASQDFPAHGQLGQHA